MEQKITLKTSLQYLKGVGPERSKVLARLGLEALGDLFYYFPRRYENRLPVKKISEISLEDKECVAGTISSRGLMRLKTGRTIFRVVVSEGRNVLQALWFNQPYLQKIFTPKSKVIFYGKVEKAGSRLQMTHPEFEIFPDAIPPKTIHSGRITPVYPLTEDLSQKGIRQLVYRAIADHSDLVHDPVDPATRARLGLRDRAWALREIHFPAAEISGREAYKRLVFDEFFALQLALEVKKAEYRKENRLMTHADKRDDVKNFLETLEFDLTPGQEKAVWEIVGDMASGRTMNRLVQGDVGSGKTVVAAAALVFTAANGFQGALMAPTEVLAQQLYLNLSQLLEPLGISCAYLAQNLASEDREAVLGRLASGSAQIVVGTHALIEENVRFKKLGLAVIDEQHKFGVFQRSALSAKGGASACHFLVMTATPIPRTLALTLYGDLDISVIAGLPSGRQPVRTFWVEDDKRTDIYRLLDALVERGGQGYVLCPAVESKGKFDAKSVFEAHEDLSRMMSHRRFSALHGKMKSDEKRRIMQDFRDKKIDVLISTVVIEVGVDVPNANIMIIENAERFGLAQLHQLRGRVGRGSTESFCVLFSDSDSDETAERLKAFTETQSGFEIAEKDLALRGGGDILGGRQHGFPELRIGDIVKDIKILELAKNEARRIVSGDPKLASAKNSALRRMVRERCNLNERAAVPA